jgi:succinate dehydrogenase assembly factor 2
MISAIRIFNNVGSYSNKSFPRLFRPTTAAAVAVPNPTMFAASFRRGYLGDAGDAVNKLSVEEEALIKIAKPKADAIFQKHIELPNDDLVTRQKRLIYRSKQRGWLEVDLLLGTWASENVPKLQGDELDQFEDFVNMETIDIYNVITLRLDVPEHMKRNGEGVVEKIQAWARSNPLGKACPEVYKAVKTEHKLI